MKNNKPTHDELQARREQMLAEHSKPQKELDLDTKENKANNDQNGSK